MKTAFIAIAIFAAVGYCSAAACDQKKIEQCAKKLDGIKDKDTIMANPGSLWDKSSEELQQLMDSSCSVLHDITECLGEDFVNECFAEQGGKDNFILMIVQFAYESAKVACRDQNKQVIVDNLPCLREALDDEQMRAEGLKCIEKYEELEKVQKLEDACKQSEQILKMYKECFAAPIIKKCGNPIERVVCGIIDNAVVPTLHKMMPADEFCQKTPVFCSS